MFKRKAGKDEKSKLISYVMPSRGLPALPDDIEAGWYVFDGDMWQWTRDQP